jgi:hypothetical protein
VTLLETAPIPTANTQFLFSFKLGQPIPIKNRCPVFGHLFFSKKKNSEGCMSHEKSLICIDTSKYLFTAIVHIVCNAPGIISVYCKQAAVHPI